MVNSMLVSSGAPQNLWGKALLTVNYILNRVSHKKLGLIPFELWHERAPSYHYLKMWGYLAKVITPLPKETKLGAKIMDCIFIGYALNSSAYRFLVHKSKKSDIHVNMIIEFRDVVLFDYIFPYKREEEKTSRKRTHEIAFRNESPKESIGNAEVETKRSQRSRISILFGTDFIAYAIGSKPQIFKEAMSTPEV